MWVSGGWLRVARVDAAASCGRGATASLGVVYCESAASGRWGSSRASTAPFERWEHAKGCYGPCRFALAACALGACLARWAGLLVASGCVGYWAGALLGS